MGAALSRLWRAVFARRHQPFPFTYCDTLDVQSVRLLRFIRPRWFTFGLVKPKLLQATYPIDKLPKYVALSYTWGAPQDGVAEHEFGDRLPILVNGQQFLVLRNLMDALRSLLRVWDFDDDVQHLWIDAICINQKDLAERAAQVGIMDQVYKRASTTAIWLGRATPGTEQAMRMFKAIRQIPSEEFAPYYQQYPNGTAPPDGFWHARGLPSLEEEDQWNPLVHFFELRWFSRAWIIQEVTLSSKNICLLWGRHFLTWDDLGHIAFAGQAARLGKLRNMPALTRYLSGNEGSAEEVEDWVVHDPLVNSFQLWYNRHRYLQRGRAPAEDTLLAEMRALSGCSEATAASWLMYFSLTNRWADATDPRDKVFGHLGLVNNIAKEDGFRPSEVHALYSTDITASRIYEQVMAQLVDETDSLAVLMALNDPPSSRLPRLPSWVPDLSRRQGLDLMWSIRPQFNAVSSLERHEHRRSLSGSRKIRIDGPRLHVRGTVIGSVATLSASLPDFIGPNWHRWADQLLELDAVYPYTNESRVEAFWRTLLMDSVSRRCPAQWPGRQNGDMFRAFVLQSMARYCPGPDSDGVAYGKYLCQLRNVNELSAADFSGHMPSFTGLRNLTSQIADVGEESLHLLSDETVLEALAECVDKASAFLIGMDGSMVNRRIVISDLGHLANGPMWAETGDKIAILESCPCPVVLRPHREQPWCYMLVGSAYVHGVMYGEAMAEDTKWENMCLR